ncbi:TPA: hypothetical protein VBM32_002222 [Streptococcus agalactiae]|nr:hypothetical protein [Streptococcus agalactiae]
MEDNIGVELKPNLDNIPLLARPMLHYTMFGVAPREIMGKAAFNTIKDKVREDCDCHCEICGRVVLHNSQDKDWLYCHEVYQVDKEKKLYTLERYVGICQQCYHYIHTGRLITLSERGKVNRDYFSRVIKKGNNLLKMVDLKKERNTDIDKVYALSYEGQIYINDYYSAVAEYARTKNVNVIHFGGVPKCLPNDEYYHSSKKK